MQRSASEPVQPFDPGLFLDAQARSYRAIVDQLKAGHKDGHWMWFVFPQMRGLGKSFYADLYGLSGRGDAELYLAHPKLGSRLRECCSALLVHESKTAFEIFGTPDDLKLHACLTLFDAVSAEDVFKQALDRFFGGQRHGTTMDMISPASRRSGAGLFAKARSLFGR